MLNLSIDNVNFSRPRRHPSFYPDSSFPYVYLASEILPDEITFSYVINEDNLLLTSEEFTTDIEKVYIQYFFFVQNSENICYKL